MLNTINCSQGRQKLIVYVVLVLVTLAVFWQVNQYDFIILDDDVYVTANSHIKSGITLDGIRWAFGTTYAEFWQPLIWLSFMFDYQLHGLNAGGYHLTNLILHIMSTLLLFWFFNRMTGAIWKSAFVAAFFALHPLHVESVAWITERKDTLSAFFWMLTLCLYVYYTEKPVIKRYLLVLFSFACALMSKPIVVTLPVVMILLDYWPLRRFESHKTNLISLQLKEKAPFFILSMVFSIMTAYLHSNTPIERFPLDLRLANALVSLATYLENTFWPHDMGIFYPFPTQIPLWQIIGASLLIIFISVTVIVMVKRLPYLFTGWMWFTIAIAPVIGIIQDSGQAMADRYHYIPSIGIGMMLAWGIPLLIPNETRRKKILFPLGIAFLAIMSFITWQQCGYWKNSVELFKKNLRATNNNFVAHNGLATALVGEGKNVEAIYHCNAAIRFYPNYRDAYNNRGVAYDQLGQYQRAIEDYNKAIRISPNYADAYYNRGVTFTKLSQYKPAVEDYNHAIRLKPYDTDALINRGVIYLNHGYSVLGCNDAQKACKLGNCTILKIAKERGYCR
jgi:protein O-mannosyl-transferase